MVTNLPAMQEMQEIPIQSLGQKDPWRGAWQHTSVLLLGKSHGERSLVGYSPCGCRESDMTETTVHTCTKAESMNKYLAISLLNTYPTERNCGLLWWPTV